MEEKTQSIKTEALPPEVRANMLSNETSIFFNVALFEQAQRIAQMFAASTMVPAHFRGNLGNCMIGLNYASRIKADPFMVLQSLYVVHGRPGIEGKLVEAVINQSEKYSEPLQYIWLDPNDKEVTRQEVLKAQVPSEYGCQAFTIDKKSGKRVDGPKITWAIVKAEGWYDKKGPDETINSNKWRTIPEMMFYYRAASWFGNKNCPELKLGMHTVEEIEDIVDLRKEVNGSFGAPVVDLNEKLKTPTEKPKEDVYEIKDLKSEKKEKPEEEKDPIRAEYIKLKVAGFKQWVEKHLEYIPKMEQKYQDEIRDKWYKLIAHLPYPLDKPEATPELSTSSLDDEGKAENTSQEPIGSIPLEDNEQKVLRLVENAQYDSWKRIMVPCPNKENRHIVLDSCLRCEMREECPTWAEYDRNQRALNG